MPSVDAAEGDTELPGYSPHYSNASTPSTTTSERVVSLETSKGHKWASLVVKSRSPSSQSLPLFYEGDVITGRFELDLEKPETIKGIVVAAHAGTTSVGQEEERFLDVRQELWSPSMGIPGEKPSSSSKFKGEFSWPFSINLPAVVTVSETKGSARSFPLPPSFQERASPAYLDYKLTVTIKRPALKVNNVLSVTFAYFPVTRADPPSRLRQLSYREGTGLVGPDGDPDGWHVLPPVKISGTLFESKSVEVECRLAIATPLSYVFGSPIPLVLTLSSSDLQLLDLLSKPSSVRIYLVRLMSIGSDATNEVAVGRSNNAFKEGAGRAALWPSTEGAAEDGKKVLQGEIDIKKTTKPSFVFPRFAIRYSIDFLPFEAPGFTTQSQPMEVLSSTKITVVTARSPGVVPCSYAPPGYVQPAEGDYNRSMGLLENGNQRFYHHHGSGGTG